MKHLKHFIAAGALFCLATSCESILKETPEDRSTINNFFQSTENLDHSLTAAYRQLVDNAWNRSLGGARSRTVFMGADDFTSQPGGNKADFKAGDQLNIGSSDINISGTGWNLPYDVILQSNFAIQGIEDLIARGEDETTVKAMGAEAYFLRAWSYFRLVRLYGDVPVVLDPSYSQENANLARTPVKEVYQQILSDLEFAIEHLPKQQVERGRVSYWAAKALKADVHLTMAGWPLKETENYALALKAAEDVINNGGFSFEEDFAPIFDYNRQDSNTEYIWQLKFCNVINCPGAGLITTFASQTTKPGELGGFQDIYVEIAYYNKFPEGNRKDFTFLSELKTKDGTTIPWEEFTWKHPFLSKFYSGTVNKDLPYEDQVGTTAPSSDLDLPMYRITEMMLIYAEAQVNGGGGEATKALEYLNQVRRRGKGVPTNQTDADDLMAFTAQDVIDERGWEFIGEQKRWFDLIRTETLENALSDRDPSENPLIGDPSNKNFYLLPLPDIDLELNPNLTQNPR
ncbi:RagB/SusD family nutrient uptake outer membrane protein [Flammeovirga agarivorans]|uniref:RagB/SusD family nutrient uptake outer membrane protein n=1 Tax=Flammeovirga agarivorans TaxID=2726742 RepID=A0A7X8SNY4_9BACT|nr:RagB/SusD family nutrient uptake outer membrane protein [Flammeovirga agarivorans]NLR93726.1 RagB/SusD family nutrient uptake outer membrane protein [Flammeovirga agarivorans]